MTPSNFIPIRVVEVDIDRPLDDLAAKMHGASGHSRFMLLVRLHGAPIGIVRVDSREPVLSAGELVDAIQQELGQVIAHHLEEDGLNFTQPLTAAGLPVEGQPACAARRAALLENPPLASVIIATRDRASRLPTALDSALAQTYPHFEVIVVDNAPHSSETRDLIEARYADAPRVRYIREDRPGLASAHNAGITHAGGAIFAFADDDLCIDRNWLSALVAAFRATEHVGCVTGMIMPAELDEPSQLWFDQYGRLNKGLESQVFDLETHRRDSPLYPYAAGSFGSGANMAFSREALEAVGGFDTAMGTGTSARGGDDLAAFFDVIVAGFRLVYEPAALVWHSHPTEYRHLQRQAYGYGVGLAAYLTRTIVRYPRHALTMLTRLPQAAEHIFSPASPKNIGKTPDYPAELNRLERLGMLAGPFAYVKSRWETRAWSGLEAYQATAR